MKVDWDELKRLNALCTSREVEGRIRMAARRDLSDALYNTFPAILAEREAAQRLRDATRPFCKIADGTVGRIPTERLSAANWHELWKALAAFDKETQNEG